jgi:hypothetical protein
MVIADTGYFVALADRGDPFHLAAKAASAALDEPIITTWPVLTEASYMLLGRLGVEALIRFMQSYAAGAFRLFDLNPGHAPRIQALLRRYADQPMDLADATLVVLAELLGDGRILSTDARDFRVYRWKNRRPFENLLLRK